MNNKVKGAIRKLMNPVQSYQQAWDKWKQSPRHKKGVENVKNRKGIS